MGEVNGNVDPFELVRAEVMLTAYDVRWAGEMDRYEVLGVEEEFRAPLLNPDSGVASRTWLLGGKLDVRVREVAEAQRVLIVEHKTKKGKVAPGDDYLKRLRLDGQVSVYFAGSAALGTPADSCLYDVLVKPAQMPSQVPLVDENGVKIVLDAAGERVKTKDGKKFRETGDTAQGYVLQTRPETPEEYRARLVEDVVADPNSYLLRTEVVRFEQEMKDAMADVWQLGRVMRENELAKRFPRNPGACVLFGSTCAFFPACTGEASLDDSTLYRRSDVAHPELSGEAGHDLLTSSRLSTYRACPRLHHLKYDLGYRPATEAETLRFGSLVHRGLEAWWRARDGERLEAALAALNPNPTNAA